MADWAPVLVMAVVGRLRHSISAVGPKTPFTEKDR
jgi:hypothetical protein